MPITLPDDKVIITVAQTAALVTKQMNPNLPEQPDEIAESAWRTISIAVRESLPLTLNSLPERCE